MCTVKVPAQNFFKTQICVLLKISLPAFLLEIIMSSNRVVTYIDINLNSVETYWNDLIIPSVQDFRNSPSPRTVFSAAHAVWHLHDWVWHVTISTLRIYAYLFRKRDDKSAAAINEALAGFGA